MADQPAWPRFATAMSFVFLVAAAAVLYLSAIGRFRSMATFPTIFAIVLILALLISMLLDRQPGRKLRALLGVLAILLAGLSPFAQNRFLAAERRAAEARGLDALTGLRAPSIPYIEAIGTEGPEASIYVPGARVTLLNFWATWCAPCREEIPRLERLWQAHRGAGLAVIGVTKLYGEGPDEATSIQQLVADLGVSYPVIVAGEDSPGHAAYAVRSIPTSVLIHRNGHVVAYGVGKDGAERLMNEAIRLLDD